MNQELLTAMKSKLLAITIVLVSAIGLIVAGYFASLPPEEVVPPVVTPPAKKSVLVNTDKVEYQKGDVIKISVKNNSAESIFLGGCNQFGLEKKENEEWKAEPPLKVCVWEGYAVKVGSKETVNYMFDAFKLGTFRIFVGYSTGCEDNKPISEAGCKAGNTVYSGEFSVGEISSTSGQEVKFETVLKGGYNEYYNEDIAGKYFAIKSDAEWGPVLGRLAAELPAPIDFNKDMLIAAFQGSRPTGGYSIEIMKITEKDNNIEVYIKEVSPGPRWSCFVTEAFTSPYHIVKLKKSAKEIVFRIENETTDCSGKKASYEEKLAACRSIPNNSVKGIKETTRLFMNLPRDIYPDKENNFQFLTVSGNATVGWVSNAGPYGEAFESTPSCWSYYYEFGGNGEVDLKAKSAIAGMPDYFVRFLVSP